MREGATVLTVSESGLGRRTDPSLYRRQSRGGKGLRNYDCEKNGPVAGVKMVDNGDDVILITDGGVLIRIPVSEITIQSRYGGGVRCMRVDEQSRVVTLARVPKDENQEEETTETSEEMAEQAEGQQALETQEETDSEE